MRSALRCLVTLLAAALLLAGCESGGDTPSSASSQTGPTSTASPMPTFATDSAVGSLAPGFPAEYGALPPHTTIVASAAIPGETTTRISLTLRSTESADDIAAYYAGLLGGLGYTSVPTATPSGLAAISGYTRTSNGSIPENITVAILDDGSSRSVSVSGDVVPAQG